MGTSHILIVEDVRVQAVHLQRLLERDGHQVTVCPDAASAFAIIEGTELDLVLADLRLADSDGLSLFRRVQETHGEAGPAFVILTAYGTVESAREALKSGVYDYITKPVDHRELQVLVKNVLEYRRLRQENRALSRAVLARQVEEQLVGRSRAFQATVTLAKAAAESEATILVRGESGTGKELIAELIHAASPRAAGPFVKVNCGAIPEPLLEAELFGHEQGAFTDARQTRKGRFELANDGTIFLDEIGEMSPNLQVKLLRVLQERELERLGSQGEVIQLDIRLVAATNRDLEAMVTEGTFREDLYYRINVISIHAPPLRERRGDIELLANHFCASFNAKNEKGFEGVSAEALAVLRRYHWPGNVRQLENVIERAVVLGKGRWIQPEHLPTELLESPMRSTDQTSELVDLILDAGVTLDEFGRLLVERALEASEGNVSQAARLLGLTRRTLQYRMARDGIVRST
jgi:two-component system response regulator HydG